MDLKTNGFNPWLLGLAIMVIGVLVAYALSQGIDGALFMSCIAIIGGIVGYNHREVKEVVKNGETYSN